MKNFKTVPKSIEDNVIKIQSRYMSDPTLSDIDFNNKLAWVWTTLKLWKKVLVHEALLTVTIEFQ